jgi:hypothetical protein
LAPPLREPPQRTYSFDPNAARQAWRQVARTRGAYAMNLGGREPGTGRLAMVALGLVAAAALLLWWSTEDDARPSEHAAVGVAAVEASPDPASAPVRPSLLPEPADVEPPMPAGASSFADASEEEIEPPQPRAERIAPPGTLEGNAKALRKIPHASTDRAPLGGIGPRGMHVDRIGMGTRIQDGACMGPTGKFSVHDDHHAHVCFRVVHPRIHGQRVIVRWERNGMLVRRTVVPIADSHAYRTRATLPLRRTFRGDWTVRIVSTDGIELAAHSFQVL